MNLDFHPPGAQSGVIRTRTLIPLTGRGRAFVGVLYLEERHSRRELCSPKHVHTLLYVFLLTHNLGELATTHLTYDLPTYPRYLLLNWSGVRCKISTATPILPTPHSKRRIASGWLLFSAFRWAMATRQWRGEGSSEVGIN